MQDFYVDSALKSFPTDAEAIDVLQRAQKMLALSNLHLHKIASKKVEVVKAFPSEARVKGIKKLDLTTEEFPVQCSLGERWTPTSGTFTLHVPQEQKPSTCCGVLSTVNSFFDPLRLLAPETIKGRLLLRGHNTLQSLTSLHISCTYFTSHLW